MRRIAIAAVLFLIGTIAHTQSRYSFEMDIMAEWELSSYALAFSMVPLTGEISMDDVRTEMGDTDSISISNALDIMGESSNPDEMNEMRGYDHDWLGYLQGVSATYDYDTGDVDMTVQNKSISHSYSGTLYWELYVDSASAGSGSVGTGSVSASGSVIVSDIAAPKKAPTHINFRFNTSGSWQTVSM